MGFSEHRETKDGLHTVLFSFLVIWQQCGFSVQRLLSSVLLGPEYAALRLNSSIVIAIGILNIALISHKPMHTRGYSFGFTYCNCAYIYLLPLRNNKKTY